MSGKKCIVYIASFLFLVCIPVGAAAQSHDDSGAKDSNKTVASQDMGDDDLSLLEEIAEESSKEETDKPSVLRQFGKNLGGSVQARYIFYIQNVEKRENADLQNEHFDYILRFNSYTGSKTWRFDVDGWVEGGNQAHTYTGVTRLFEDPNREKRRYLEISETYLTLYQNNFDIYLGKKILKNGLSVLYSPANRYVVYDLHDPLASKEIGAWQARTDYYWNNYTFTGVFLPLYPGSRIPHESSRWRGVQKGGNPDFQFRNETDLTEDYPDTDESNLGYFLRAKTVLRGWDLFLSAYTGPNPFLILAENITLFGGIPFRVPVKKTVNVANFTTGFSTAYQNWEFHAEALYQHAYAGKDDNYINAVGGFTYTFHDLAKRLYMDRIDVTFEYARDWTLLDQYAKDFIRSSAQTRLGRNDIFARIKFQVNPDLKFVYNGNYEFIDDSHYNHFKCEWEFKDGWRWAIVWEMFQGEGDGYFGRWDRNDRVYTSLKYSY